MSTFASTHIPLISMIILSNPELFVLINNTITIFVLKKNFKLYTLIII